MDFSSILNPEYVTRFQDWNKWRSCYEGGQTFVDDYLHKFSAREDDDDFKVRKAITPIPGFAKAAINDIRNSIFQRMAEVTRTGGSGNYQQAVNGFGPGVDRKGSSMTAFIGRNLLTELLVMQRVGVWIDAPATASMTIKGNERHMPYIYAYKVEQIKNWKRSNPEDPNAFQSVTLEETIETYDTDSGMPSGTVKRIRHAWISPKTGKVNVQFITDSKPEPPIELQLTRIPFVLLDLGDSLIKDVAQHQIALLNLWSSNVSYAAQSNFPIYTEMRDARGGGTHLKPAADGAATGTSDSADNAIQVGVARGRSYDMNAERPGFIAPPAEPLLASMQMCETLKRDTRELINLAVVGLGTQASAESKAADNSGLEAGLSFIGLILEAGERDIARHWAAYESTSTEQQKVSAIAYPKRWSLKSDAERTKDASDLHAVIGELPSRTAKRETSKLLIQELLRSKVTPETMQKILAEIDGANYTTSNPDVIQLAKEQGMLSAKTGAVALGFDASEAELAADEHIKRLAEIARHQTKPVQGVPDTQADPNQDQDAISARERGKGSLSKVKP